MSEAKLSSLLRTTLRSLSWERASAKEATLNTVTINANHSLKDGNIFILEKPLKEIQGQLKRNIWKQFMKRHSKLPLFYNLFIHFTFQLFICSRF